MVRARVRITCSPGFDPSPQEATAPNQAAGESYLKPPGSIAGSVLQINGEAVHGGLLCFGEGVLQITDTTSRERRHMNAN